MAWAFLLYFENKCSHKESTNMVIPEKKYGPVKLILCCQLSADCWLVCGFVMISNFMTGDKTSIPHHQKKASTFWLMQKVAVERHSRSHLYLSLAFTKCQNCKFIFIKLRSDIKLFILVPGIKHLETQLQQHYS